MHHVQYYFIRYVAPTIITMTVKRQTHGRHERVEVFYGIDNNINAKKEFIDSSKNTHDVCADSKGFFFYQDFMLEN